MNLSFLLWQAIRDRADELPDAVLALSEFCLEVHAHTEDSPCEGQALCHVPEHPVRDIAFREEGDEGENNTRHHHEGCGAVLDPFFAVCSHRDLNLLVQR